MVDRNLFRANLRIAPAQPAVALWRGIEVGHLLRSGVLPREGRGLDLGCGDGAVTGLIRERLAARWSLVGVDPDERELRLVQPGQYERLEATEGSAVDEPDGSFDFVLSNSVLEHIPDLEATLREVARVLKPGGVLVFTVPSAFFHRNLGGPGLTGRLATGESDPERYHRAFDRRVAHLRYPTVDEWTELLAAVGLELEHASFYLSPRETRRWAAFTNATGGLLVRVTGTERPIEIQRRLNLRRRDAPLWLRGVSRALGELAVIGLERTGDLGSDGSSLLVQARRQATGAAAPSGST